MEEAKHKLERSLTSMEEANNELERQLTLSRKQIKMRPPPKMKPSTSAPALRSSAPRRRPPPALKATTKRPPATPSTNSLGLLTTSNPYHGPPPSPPHRPAPASDWAQSLLRSITDVSKLGHDDEELVRRQPTDGQLPPTHTDRERAICC